MTSYFASMIDVVSAHPYYAYSAIFLAALSEAIPLVGTVVPGSTLVVAISALAAGAGANSWVMLVAATVGAIVGDGVSFWLGQRYHREILSSWPLDRYPKVIERSNRFITRFGAASVLSGALYGGRTSLCSFDSRHPQNVAASVLCRQHFVRSCMGTRSCIPRCAACDRTKACWRNRRAAYCSHYRGIDRCIGRCLDHAACFCAFVVPQCRPPGAA